MRGPGSTPSRGLCRKDAYGPTKGDSRGGWVDLVCPGHGGPTVEDVTHCGSPCDFCGVTFSGFLIEPCAKRIAALPKMYTYRQLVTNDGGRVYPIEPNFWANSLEDAVKICREKGWEFVGAVCESIPAPEMEDYCNRVQEQRDREWLGKG